MSCRTTRWIWMMYSWNQCWHMSFSKGWRGWYLYDVDRLTRLTGLMTVTCLTFDMVGWSMYVYVGDILLTHVHYSRFGRCMLFIHVYTTYVQRERERGRNKKREIHVRMLRCCAHIFVLCFTEIPHDPRRKFIVFPHLQKVKTMVKPMVSSASPGSKHPSVGYPDCRDIAAARWAAWCKRRRRDGKSTNTSSCRRPRWIASSAEVAQLGEGQDNVGIAMS